MQGFIQDFMLGGDTFLGVVNTCAKQKLCKSHPSRGVWGHAPPPPEIKKIAGLRLNLVGFGS